MCRFKLPLPYPATNPLLFQYILCVGSSEISLLLKIRWEEFQYILCVGSSGAVQQKQGGFKEFQYILCVGSRALLKRYLKTL